MKSNLIFLAMLITFILSGCNSKEPEDAIIEDGQIPVKVIPVREHTYATVISTSGRFTTDDETPLSFKNGGIISQIYVREGDAIRAGQLLASVNTTEIQAVAQQAALALDKARRDYHRAANLYKDSVATLEQMQNAKTALEVARQQKNSADFNLKHTQIRALKNGFVLRRFLQAGQVAGPGVPVLLVNGVGGKDWLFRTSVSDYQWSSIEIGDSAKVETDVAPGKLFPARVSKKSEGVDPETGAFTIELTVTKPASISLASGLFGKADIHPSGKTAGWQIPYDALLDGDGNTGFVFITNDRKTAKKVTVSISEIRHGQVAVSYGLQNADFLIISGSAYLKDGSPIRIIE